MQNFNESFFLEPLLDGELALPAGDVGEPFVDADDIADVAVAALTEPGHVGATYELTGPRLLTFEQAVDEIVAATGRAMRYVPITPAEHAAAMDAAGVPDDVAGLVSYLFGEVLDGRNAVVADGVPGARAGAARLRRLRPRRGRHRCRSAGDDRASRCARSPCSARRSPPGWRPAPSPSTPTRSCPASAGLTTAPSSARSRRSTGRSSTRGSWPAASSARSCSRRAPPSPTPPAGDGLRGSSPRSCST